MSRVAPRVEHTFIKPSASGGALGNAPPPNTPLSRDALTLSVASTLEE